MAECCKPIPGDKVVGYKDPATHRIIVHKATCDELDRLAAQFGDATSSRRKSSGRNTRPCRTWSTIELRGIDRMGILLDLAKTSARTSASISARSISRRTTTSSRAAISLYVKDAEGLHAIMDKIRKIKGIDTVKT